MTLGKVLILLQYQASAQRIKVMVRKAENLTKLTRIPGAPGDDPSRVLSKAMFRLPGKCGIASLIQGFEDCPSRDLDCQVHLIVGD